MGESRTGVREISIEEFDEMIENHDDLLILDVREVAEFRRGHIPAHSRFHTKYWKERQMTPTARG